MSSPPGRRLSLQKKDKMGHGIGISSPGLPELAAVIRKLAAGEVGTPISVKNLQADHFEMQLRERRLPNHTRIIEAKLVEEGGAAYRKGVRHDDILTHVCGTPTVGMRLDNVGSLLASVSVAMPIDGPNGIHVRVLPELTFVRGINAAICVVEAAVWQAAPTLKFIVLGDTGVGKTRLLARFVTECDIVEPGATTGADVMAIKNVTLADGSPLRTRMWDTSGAYHSRATVRSFFHKVNYAVIVYDVTRPETLDNAGKWLAELREVSPDVTAILVGNKIDLEDRRIVSATRGEAVARELGLICSAGNPLFAETSAVEAETVYRAFDRLLRDEAHRRLRVLAALKQAAAVEKVAPISAEAKVAAKAKAKAEKNARVRALARAAAEREAEAEVKAGREAEAKAEEEASESSGSYTE
jgi:small GTP-binding protein